MKRLIAVVTGVVLVAGLLTACQSSSDDQRKKELDHAIHELQQEFTTLYGLGPSASADSVRKAAKRIDAKWKEVEAAAEHVESVDLEDASRAHGAFVDAVEGLPNTGAESTATAASTATAESTTTADSPVMNTIMPTLQEFRAAVEKMHEAGEFHHGE